MKSPTKTIWKTVVFAGAMLALPACGGKSNGASTTPENAGGEETVPADDTGGDPCAATDPCAGGEDPCAGVDPCAGGEDPCEGGVGRGFILS
jgi:hypothetical protein